MAAEPRVYDNPTMSPDGSRVALYVTDLGNTDIWVWHIARETLTRRTFDEAIDTAPFWSRDGSRIVFDRRDGGLFWQRADGVGTAERLLESTLAPSGFAWAPDGSLILSEQTRAGGPRDIRLLKIDGERSVTPLVSMEFNEQRPALSPNGQWLAYQSNESGLSEIYVRPFPEGIRANGRSRAAEGKSQRGRRTAIRCITWAARA